MYRYPTEKMAALRTEIDRFRDFVWMQCEYNNCEEAAAAIEKLNQSVKALEAELNSMPGEPLLAAREPNEYEKITALSEGGNVPAKELPNLEKRMLGALNGRFAGCMLGAPIEGWKHYSIKAFAEQAGMEYPPENYWKAVPNAEGEFFGLKRTNLQRGHVACAGVDDDITYTLLGYQILKEYGPNFTTADVGEAWKKYLPHACTAEEVALRNLKAGIPAEKAAEIDNPYRQWIGADIRADAFAYAAAGDPHRAAAYGYRDAYLSHRRNGIYGEMYFAAAEAAAFTADDPMEALRIGMKEIPTDCLLYHDLAWAFETCPKIHTYEDGIAAIAERFGEQSHVHTNNNACLVVFGLHLGGLDFTKTIGQTVAMGYDNDCTAATVGSILGAVIGIDRIPAYWYECFNNTVRTYMIGRTTYAIDEVAADLCDMARAGLHR